MNNYTTIVFFHNNVNGDCYITRYIINHIIKYTNKTIQNYYYSAPRSIVSHCSDIGILDSNFNNIHFYSDNIVSIKNNNIYIHVWVGNYINKVDFCCFCLKNFNICFNSIIEELNLKCNFSIPLIDTSNVLLPFNYDFYNCKILNNFIENIDIKYKKKILVYNVNPTTFITINKSIHEHYLSKLSNKYKDFLFITFCESDIKNENIISLHSIYNISSVPLNNGYGIEFSYLSIFCDKIIGIPSGVFQFSFNNENKNIKNKYMMFFDNTNEGNPGRCPVCEVKEDQELLCCKNIDLYINVCLWKHDYNFTTDFVDNFICL